MTSKPTFILIRPQLPENIGAVARAMANFSLDKLRLVSPLVSVTDPKALATSAGADYLLQEAAVFESFEEAIADLDFVYGTCATQRHMIKTYISLREATSSLSDHKNVGIVFGPERTGMTNEEISFCHAILQIPVNPHFSSLNLAQAVILIAYEWFQSKTSQFKDVRLGETTWASQSQIQFFFKFLEQELDACDYWRVPTKKPIMWRNLRNIFTRTQLSQQDVQTLWGMIRSLTSGKR